MIKQISRFVIVGVVNTIVYYVLYLVMQEWAGYLAAHIIAFGLAMTSSFFLNCYFTYQVRPTLRRFLLFPLSNVANFIVTTVGVVVLVEFFDVGELLAPPLAAVVSIPITYVVARAVLTGRLSGSLTHGNGASDTSPIDVRASAKLWRNIRRTLVAPVGAAITTIGSYLYLLAGRNVWPFGHESLLQSDMGGQYALYFAWFGRVVRGEDSIYFTWSGDLGMNTWPLYSYYLSSPFNLIFAAVDDASIPQAIVVVTAAKLAFSAAAMTVALKLLAPSAPGLARIALSAAYAMCTWGVIYGFHLMWLDALYTLPLIFAAVELLLRRQMISPLAMAVALAVITNLYTGAMVLIFGALFFFVRLYMTRQDSSASSARTWASWAIAQVTGLSVGAAIVIPTLIWIGYRSEIPIIDRPSFPAGWRTMAVRLLSGSAEWGYDQSPNIAVTSGALVLACAWLFCRDVALRERLIMVGLAGVVVLSFRWALLYEAWHGFAQPTAWPFRFAFVVPAMLTVQAAWALSSRDHRGRAAGSVVGAAGVTLIALMARSSFGDLVNDRGLLISVGGAILVMLVCVAWVYPNGIARYSRSLQQAVLSVSVAIFALVIVVEASVSARISARVIPPVEDSAWAPISDDWVALTAQIQPAHDEFFRADADYGRTHNDAMRFGYYSATHYSSTGYGPAHLDARDLGLSTHLYGAWMAYAGSTVVTDALFNFRYLLTNQRLDRYGWHTVAGNGETWLSENDLTLPSGWLASGSNDLNVIDTPFERQNALVGIEAFTPVCDANPKATSAEVDVNGDRLEITPALGVESYAMTWSCRTIASTQVYAWVPQTVTGARISQNASDVALWPTIYRNGIFDLGRHNRDEFTVTLEVPAQYTDLPANVVQGVDMATLTTRLDELRSTSGTVVSHSKSGSLIFDVEIDREGQYVVPVPATPGWLVTVDGVSQEWQEYGDLLLSIDMSEGKHRVELTYVVPGLRAGVIGTLGGLTLLVALVVFDVRRVRRTSRRFP